jgi:hypothetical protein
MEFNYVTPYWRDSHEFFGEGINSYTGTYFFILNPNNERAYVKIFFYNLEGSEFKDMQIEQILPENHVLDFRIVDIIAFKDPSYRIEKNLRTGWLKIVSDVPLNISGKITSGDVNSKGARIEDSWSIPFQQLTAIVLDGGAPKPFRPRPLSDFEEYMKKKKRPL